MFTSEEEANVPSQWNVGDRIINLYKVRGLLGEGGFGQVYRVTHLEWNIDLAVKTPSKNTIDASGGVDNFEKEAQTWVNLGLHPHAVSCYYVRRLGGTPRVFVEYMKGGSLHDWIYGKDGEPAKLYQGETTEVLERILDIAIQFAWGLHYAHETGLVHKDVKPENVMVTPNGTVKVTDFGLARSGSIVSPQAEINPQQTLIVSKGGGTPAYLSPEQSNGEPLTRRSDLFSWAISVFEIFKGDKWWDCGDIAAYDTEYFLEAGSVNDSQLPIPESVKQLLYQCFKEDPDQRPHDMLVVANELKDIYEQEIGNVYPRPEPNIAELIADDLNNRALSLMDLGQEEEALQLWNEALKKQPQHPEATYNRGLYLWRTGKVNDDQLIANLESIQDSGNLVAKYLLAETHMERDDCESAIKILESIEGKEIEQELISKLLTKAKQRLPQSTRLLNKFRGHSDVVRSVSLSSDGKLALSGSDDKTLKLWDVETGNCLRTFEGHQEEVLTVYLSKNKLLAISGSNDKTLRIWNVENGNCIEIIEGFKRAVTSVYLSDDNQLLLSGERRFWYGSNNLKLWKVETTKCLLEFEGHTQTIYSCCIDQNNQLILSGGGDRVLKLWDIKTGERLQMFGELNKGFYAVFGHKITVSSVAFTNNNVLSGSMDSTLKLWNKDTGACLRTFEGHSDRITSISVIKNGNFAISSEESQKLKLWNLETGQCLRTFPAHSDRVTSVSISECGKLAVSASFDKTLQLWQINCIIPDQYSAPPRLSRFLETEFALKNEKIYQQKLKEAKIALQQEDYLTAKRHLEVAINLPGYSYREEVLKCWRSLYLHFPRRKLKDVLASSKFNFLEHLSEIAIYHYKKTPKLLGELHTSVHLDKYSHCILVGRTRSTSFNLELLKFPYLELNKSLEGFEKKWEEGIDSMRRRHDELLENPEHTVFDEIKYTLEQGTEAFKMFSTLTRRNIGWCSKTCLYLSADNSLAVSGHELGRLKLYNVETGKWIWTYRRHGIVSHNINQNIRPTISDAEVTSVCISQDNSFILSGGEDKTLKLWEIGNHGSIRASLSGDCLRTFEGHQGGVLSVCLSLDNQFALSGSADKTLKLWEVSTGHCLKTIEGHQDSVNSVCILSDAKFALSGSADNTIKLWNLETEACLTTFQGHTEQINSIFISVDNKYFISGSDDKTARLWNLETGECLQIFEGHTNKITSVCFASNNQWAVSADGEQIKVWFLDWELEERQIADWDEGARPYLETFLKQHTPYTATLPNNKKPTEEEITLSLTRQGLPLWTEKDFDNLLYTLGCAGYGWLRPEGVRQHLETMRASLQKQEYLIAAKSIDYNQLRDLLAEEKWQEANEQTWQLIVKVINYDLSKIPSTNDLNNFPSEHLHIIDQLWIDYSNGHFGFSVQKNIISAIIGESQTLQKKWNELGNCLGWRENNEWKEYNNLTFSIEANKGHLPILGGSSLPLFFWTQRCVMYSYLMLSNAWKSLKPIQDNDFDISQLLSEVVQDSEDTPQTKS